MATQSALQRAYRSLQKTKSGVCDGKKTKTQLKAAAKRYVAAAVKKGQTKTEAERKARRVMNGGCSVSTRVSGTKRKRKTTKRKTARRRTR